MCVCRLLLLLDWTIYQPESTGEIRQLEKNIGMDGKKRPRKKKHHRRPKQPVSVFNTTTG